MTTVQPPPIVLDVRDELTASDLKARLAWLEAEGIDAADTYRVEVYPGIPPTAVVYAYATNAQGHRYCELTHDHLHSTCRAASRPPETITVRMLPPKPGCPGPCNAKARKARADHVTALGLWEEAVAGWQRAHDYWLDQLAEVGPDKVFREPVRPARPPEPDIVPTVGDPVWCRRCTALIRRALADLDELASLLERWADGHRGRTSGEKTSTRRTDAPSPSPIADTLDELYAALTQVEDQWREARGYARRPQRSRNGHARMSSVSWLLSKYDDIITHPGSEQFGKATLSWQKRLQGLTRSEPIRRQRPGRCTRCPTPTRALWTRDDGYTECGVCGRLYSEDEYQRDVVGAQVDEPTDTKAQAS